MTELSIGVDLDKLQTITLLTVDGKRLTYVGKAQIDVNEPPKIADIIVGEPRELPDGCKWEEAPQ